MSESEPMFMNDDVGSLLKVWHERARRAQTVHYDSATLCGRWTYVIGVPVIMLAMIGGSSQVANVSDEFWRNAIAILTLLAAVLAALQTFLNLSERRERHREAAVRFGELKKEIEVLKRFLPKEEDKLQVAIEDLRTRYGEAVSQSPTAMRWAWSKRRKFLSGDT